LIPLLQSGCPRSRLSLGNMMRQRNRGDGRSGWPTVRLRSRNSCRCKRLASVCRVASAAGYAVCPSHLAAVSDRATLPEFAAIESRHAEKNRFVDWPFVWIIGVADRLVWPAGFGKKPTAGQLHHRSSPQRPHVHCRYRRTDRSDSSLAAVAAGLGRASASNSMGSSGQGQSGR